MKIEGSKSPKDPAQAIKAMDGACVLVVGDIMLDRFVYGSVERISPESPVPVLSVERESFMLGGAGNALANLAGLGARGKILSVTGDDEEGALIRAQAEELGLDTSGLLTSADRLTIVKTRYLAGHQQLLRTDFERKQSVSDQITRALLEKAEDLMDGVKALMISDYGKGLLTKDSIQKLIAMAKEAGVPVLVDPKGSDYSLYEGADIITPNKKELSEATGGMAVDSDEDVIRAAQKLIETCNIEAVVATRSHEGMTIVQKNGTEAVHLRTSDIEVFDVSGAGDTVIATIAAGLAAGGDLIESVMLANIAGSIVVSKVGTAPIRARELLDGLHRENDRQAQICDEDEAQEQVRRWKARGLKVGFTNGCFDILHPGHVSYLGQARGECDRLIVGLNCDFSVKILKGADRPVHDEQSRATVLSALSYVDMGVLFGADEEGQDNTAGDLIAKLQPDFYFKGGDYTLDQIPEAPGVQAYGGQVRIMPAFEGHSTTSSVKKIKNEAA